MYILIFIKNIFWIYLSKKTDDRYSSKSSLSHQFQKLIHDVYMCVCARARVCAHT